jgi:hypothetical protein
LKFSSGDPMRLAAMQPKCSTAGNAGVTQHHANHARPWSPSQLYWSATAIHRYESSEKCIAHEGRIGAGHGVATRDESEFVPGQKSMEEESAIAPSKDNLTPMNLSCRAGLNLRDIAGP